MKKIIGIIFISLMFCNIGFAEITEIEEKIIDADYGYYISTFCIDGYKFVFAAGYMNRESPSSVQFFEERDGKSLPAKC